MASFVPEWTAYLAWAIAFIWLVWALWWKWNERQNKGIQEHDPNPVQGELREHNFTDTQMAQIEMLTVDMAFEHGHDDLVGIIDDMRHGRPLNGPCWECGKPRKGLAKRDE